MSENSEKPSQPPKPNPEIGKIDLCEEPSMFDVESLSELIPGSKHLQTTDGNEYVLDGNGRTILLFGDKKDNGFGSIYSPRTKSEIVGFIGGLPEEDRTRICEALGIDEEDLDLTGNQPSSVDTGFPMLSLKLPNRAIRENSGINLALQGTNSEGGLRQRREVKKVEKWPLSVTELPKDHVLELDESELQAMKAKQWEAVKDLDDNDPKKIVYFRRFTREFRSRVPYNPLLTRQPKDNFNFFAIDTSRIGEFPSVERYETTIEVPDGAKIGIVLGYHQLEKPWGHIFRSMFENQVYFDQSRLEFIVVNNQDIPTGDTSRSSDAEIRKAVQFSGITHIIDIHEQLSMSSRYMDKSYPPEWVIYPDKIPDGKISTLDPFVPVWMIEQYFKGNVYPHLQHAVNQQIVHVENLIKSIK